jgi:hypothetical protein
MREARFRRTEKRLVVGKLGAVEGSQDKANFVRASRRLQEVVCTLLFAARSFPISEARRRFSRLLFAINVPRDGGPPLLKLNTESRSRKQAIIRSRKCRRFGLTPPNGVSGDLARVRTAVSRPLWASSAGQAVVVGFTGKRFAAGTAFTKGLPLAPTEIRVRGNRRSTSRVGRADSGWSSRSTHAPRCHVRSRGRLRAGGRACRESGAGSGARPRSR